MFQTTRMNSITKRYPERKVEAELFVYPIFKYGQKVITSCTIYRIKPKRNRFHVIVPTC